MAMDCKITPALDIKDIKPDNTGTIEWKHKTPNQDVTAATTYIQVKKPENVFWISHCFDTTERRHWKTKEGIIGA